MKSQSNVVYDTITIIFVVLTLLMFLCSLGLGFGILRPPAFLAPRTPIVPVIEQVPSSTPTYTPSFTATPTETHTPTRTPVPTRTPRPSLTPSQ
jgi:hypothetical protein